jgi:hypothetical protein
LISFDPSTNTLHHSTDASGAITSEKPVSESDLKELTDALTREGFFDTHTRYFPKENETHML